MLTTEQQNEFLEKLTTAVKTIPRCFEMASIVVNYYQENGSHHRTQNNHSKEFPLRINELP